MKRQEILQIGLTRQEYSNLIVDLDLTDVPKVEAYKYVRDLAVQLQQPDQRAKLELLTYLKHRAGILLAVIQAAISADKK